MASEAARWLTSSPRSEELAEPRALGIRSHVALVKSPSVVPDAIQGTRDGCAKD